MRKIIIVLISVMLLIGFIKIGLVFSRFVGQNLSPAGENPNTTLISTNYISQIVYNVLYIAIAIIVVLIAYYQLNKTREATTVQTISNIDEKIRSDGFVGKRIRLARYILDNNSNSISIFLFSIKNNKTLDNEEKIRLAAIKNHIEDVIYQFEFIGYYYHKRIFDIEDIYQLFSVEIQEYWLIIQKIGFVKYLRKNKLNPNKDYYDKFENLFKDILKQEIINDAFWLWRWPLQVYYWMDIYRIFYKFFLGNKNKMHRLIRRKRRAMDLFLEEESNLIIAG